MICTCAPLFPGATFSQLPRAIMERQLRRQQVAISLVPQAAE